MLGFEPQISGVRSNHSAICATTMANFSVAYYDTIITQEGSIQKYHDALFWALCQNADQKLKDCSNQISDECGQDQWQENPG